MTILACLALLAWIWLLAARGGFWRVAPDLLPALPAPGTAAPGGPAPSVLAIVPARDEAQMLGMTLPSLLAQAPGGAFHVLLVDDLSSDGTADTARAAAAACGCGDRLTVLRSLPLAPGWTGKLWAMQQGVDWAARRGTRPDLVLFSDADIRYAPGTLRRLIAVARAEGTVLTSLMVKLNVASRAERLLMPAFVLFFRMLYPFAWVRDPGRRTAAAAGGVMLADFEALTAAGGPGAIRGALIDDCAMGASMKRRGPVWLGLTCDARSLRRCPGLGDIRRMVSRSAYAELRHSPCRLGVAVAGLALVFGGPPVAALAGSGAARGAGLAAWAMMTAAFVPMLRFYRVSLLAAPLLPVIAVLYGEFTVASAVQHWRGRGGAWKGRIHAGEGAEP